MSFAQTSSKRVRGKNFTDNERDEVLKVIEKYKNIIDNKKTDAETIRLKNAAWLEVTEEFNSILPTCRTPSQLRVFYENYKTKLRKELAEQGFKNNETEDISLKRMKLTDSEEKLIVKYQKPIGGSAQLDYIDRYSNCIEASTSNTLHFKNEKQFLDNNSQRFYPDPNSQHNYPVNSPVQLEEDDDCSSEPLKIVTEVDPMDDNRYIQEPIAKPMETVKPSQAYAAIVESNKANFRLKTKKSEYVDDYNRLKIELVHSELKLKNREYENILLASAMEQRMNAVKLKILECELEIKQEQLKKEKERKY